MRVVEDSVGFGVSNGRLNLIGVNNSRNVGVGDLMGGEAPSFLLRAVLSVGSKNVVQFLEGAFGPDDKSSDVSSRSELE